MKVLHININYISSKLHQIMISKLNERNIDNIVFNAVYDTKTQEMTHEDNVFVCRCFNYRDRYLYLLKQNKIFRALVNNINVNTIDFIHTYTIFSDGYSAYKLNKKYGMPYITTVRDTDLYGFLKYKPYLIVLAIKIMSKAKAVIFLSEPYKRYLLNKIRSKKIRDTIENKSIVLKNGIDDYWLENAYVNKKIADVSNRINNRGLKIICVARIVPQKNILMLQKAIDILNGNGWKVELTVIGRNDDNLLLEEIKRHKYTRYLQPMPKEELIRYYRSADVFALVSHRETFGLVYAEAMSQGLPVIYTKGQGFDGRYEEGEVGYAVSDNDPSEIANALMLITTRYEEIFNNCVEKAKEFDWDAVCDIYVTLYQK